MKEIISNQKGATMVIVVLCLTVMLGTAALVVDVGLAYTEKSKLKNTADSAALAGALELPSFPSDAIEVASQYVEKNGFSSSIAQVITTDDDYGMQVALIGNIDYKFAHVLGFTNKQLNVTSKVIVGAVSSVYGGARPFAVEQQEFTYGQRVVLKEDGGDGYHGNYGAIALGGTGAKKFEDNIKFGYQGKLSVGDFLDTEPGNMSGPTLDAVDYIINGVEDIIEGDYCTFDNYTSDSRRLWTIPIVDSLKVEGRTTVEILGFALFFLEDAEKVKGQAEVTGRFIELVTNGDITQGQTSYGLYGTKLIQ